MGYFVAGGAVAASQLFGANQTEVFSVDQSGSLNVSWVLDAGPWQGPLTVGPAGLASAGCFVAASRQFGSTNQTDVFLVGKNGQLNTFWFGVANPSGYGPATIGLAGVAPPGCFLAASQQFGATNQTDVFLVDTNGQLNVFWIDNGGQWNGPAKIGPAGIAPPGCFVAASQQFGATNQTDVFLVDKNGQLNVFWVNNAGAWNGPEKIGPAGIAASGCFLAASQQFGATNQTDVFLVDKNGHLNVFWVNNAGAWNGPEKIGPAGIAASGCFLAASQQFGATNQTDVFLVDKNGHLNVFWVNNAGAWNGPEKIGPAGIAASGCFLAASQQFGATNQTDVFLVDKNGQLNVFWVNNAGAWNGPLVRRDPVPQPPGGYVGSANYVLANGSSCATLTGVKATVYITEDLIWESTNGAPAFSFQLNAETQSSQPLDWLQFSTHMGDDTGVWPWMNIWTPSTIPTRSPFWNQVVARPVANMPLAARIPAGYSIVVVLTTDGAERVISASWNVFDDTGESIGSVNYPLSTADNGGVPPTDLSPVASFQLTFGGVSNGNHATFSSGAGLIVVQADQVMNVDTSYPTCIGYKGGTAETSNIAYGALCASPSTMFSQAFKVQPDSAQARRANPNARKRPAPPSHSDTISP